MVVWIQWDDTHGCWAPKPGKLRVQQTLHSLSYGVHNAGHVAERALQFPPPGAAVHPSSVPWCDSPRSLKEAAAVCLGTLNSFWPLTSAWTGQAADMIMRRTELSDSCQKSQCTGHQRPPEMWLSTQSLGSHTLWIWLLLSLLFLIENGLPPQALSVHPQHGL